jgi:hypothetical protein
MAVYYEKPLGVSREDSPDAELSVDIEFVVLDCTSDTAANIAVAAGAPATRGDLVRKSWTINELVEGSAYEGVVKYVRPELSNVVSVPPPTGDSQFNFDTTGSTTHITQALEEVAFFTTTGTEPDTTMGGAIGVEFGKNGCEIKGTDIIIPAFEFDCVVYVDPDDMTDEYVDILYRYTGTVNSEEVTLTVKGITLTFAPGELLFKGARGGIRRSAKDWEITFLFAGSPNASEENPIVIGSGDDAITVDTKEGWDYLWVMYEPTTTTVGDLAIMSTRPVLVVIDRVYLRQDLNDLDIPVT